MNLRRTIRPILASVITVSWLVVELRYGISHPSLELRLMLIASLIWMFGESVTEAVDIVRGNNKQK